MRERLVGKTFINFWPFIELAYFSTVKTFAHCGMSLSIRVPYSFFRKAVPFYYLICKMVCSTHMCTHMHMQKLSTTEGSLSDSTHSSSKRNYKLTHNLEAWIMDMTKSWNGMENRIANRMAQFHWKALLYHYFTDTIAGLEIAVGH